MSRKPDSEQESCGSCRFYLAHPAERGGICRRNPPVPSTQDGAPVTLWSGVSASDWCGCFSRKLQS